MFNNGDMFICVNFHVGAVVFSKL